MDRYHPYYSSLKCVAAMDTIDVTNIPQDLSAKRKSVSVQTEESGKGRFEDLLEGVSEAQLNALKKCLLSLLTKDEDQRLVSEDNFKGGTTQYHHHEQVSFGVHGLYQPPLL